MFTGLVLARGRLSGDPAPGPRGGVVLRLEHGADLAQRLPIGASLAVSGVCLTVVEETGASHILHLAGLQAPTCRADPIRGAMVNVIGTLAVFEAAADLREQVARVVYASSAAVHGPIPGIARSRA